jgi:hypothetical protein
MAKRGRPPKGPIAYDADAVKSFITRLFEVEKEILVLREDKKELREEFKDQIDFKLIGRIIQLVKTKVRLALETNASEQTIEEIEDVVKENLNKVM